MKHICLADATLEQGTLSKEISLSFKEKIEIAKQLETLRVDVIELPSITDPKTDALVLRTVASLLKNCTLSCSVGLDESLIDTTYEALSGAAKPRLCISLPVSVVQMEYICHQKPPMMLSCIERLVTRAKATGAEVEFSAQDATRSEFDFLAEAVNTAISAGSTIITLCDSNGTLLPSEWGSLIDELYKAVPALSNVTLGVAVSNAIDMATACMAEALAHGATQIRTAVFGEQLPSLGTVAKFFASRGESLGYTCNLRQTSAMQILDKIQALAEPKQTPAVLSAPLADHSDEGVLLDESTDIATLSALVRKSGYDLSRDDMSKVYESFLRIAKKKPIGAKELDVIIANDTMQVPPTYRLISYVINCGNVLSPTAQIILEKGSRQLAGFCMGDGPIDAAMKTIEQIIGHHYELDDFQLQSVTQGREAMAQALVKLRAGGSVYSGNGLSTDVIGASIRAYLSALNKIVYEEQGR